MLAIEPDAIDAVRFERLAEQGRRELATAPADAARTLRAALALWRGEALADFTFEPFAQADITRLSELRLSALEDRIGADLALGEHRALAGELAQLVSEHPLRERLAGQFMVALYRSDRQADALRAYGRLRDTLVEQLGIEPNPTIARLEQRDPRTTTRSRLVAARSRRRSPAGGDDSSLIRGGGVAGTTLIACPRPTRTAPCAATTSTRSPKRCTGPGAHSTSLVVRQRAHAAFVEEGNVARAAMVAVMLAIWFGARLRMSVAGGWFQRAQRLLENEPECAVHGFLEWAATMFAIATGRDADAREAAQRAFDIGQRFGVRRPAGARIDVRRVRASPPG